VLVSDRNVLYDVMFSSSVQYGLLCHDLDGHQVDKLFMPRFAVTSLM